MNKLIEVLKAFNATFLNIIPKPKAYDMISIIRPISLCNVIYKIISKVVTNILRRILPILIDPE